VDLLPGAKECGAVLSHGAGVNWESTQIHRRSPVGQSRKNYGSLGFVIEDIALLCVEQVRDGAKRAVTGEMRLGGG